MVEYKRCSQAYRILAHYTVRRMQAKDTWRWRTVLAIVLLFAGFSMTLAQEEETTQWFKIDALNPGLGEVPDEVSRATPREAARSFLDLTEEGDYAAAAHLLNLSELSEAEQQEQGGTLAQQLAEVFQRGDQLNPSNLPSRQDAIIVDSSGENPMAGMTRRDIELTSLRADGQAYDIRLGRYKVENEDPVWLITPESVSAIPVLFEEYGPSMLEEHIPERYKQMLGALMIWEWVALPLFLLLIAGLGWGVHTLVGLLAKWLPPGMRSIFTGRIKIPVSLLVMSLVTQALLDYVVSFSAVATTTFRVLLIAVAAWGVGTIALRLVDTLMLNMARRLAGEIDDTKPKDERRFLTTLYATRRAIILVMVSAVSIYVLSQIQLFETLGLSLLASASVLAVLVGIAGQAVLGNILSSFQLSLAKPIRIGDLVIFEGEWCYVEGIFYTFIRLRVWDDRRIVVPVTYFVSKPFQNLSVKSAKMYRQLELILHLSTDVALLRKKFMEYAKEEECVVEHHKLLCYVTGQTATTLVITAYFMASDPISGWTAEMQIREKLLTYIRRYHPDWWPREVMVLSHEDVTRAEGIKPHHSVTATSEPKPPDGE